MTGKVLEGTYASGYAMDPLINVLRIAEAGRVDGAGVSTGSPASRIPRRIINDGSIVGSAYAGHALGVYGVHLQTLGSVVNGNSADTTAYIRGAYYGVRDSSGAAGSVANYGTIFAFGGDNGAAVKLDMGGTVSNGSATDVDAFVDGVTGVAIAGVSGSVTNFGTIRAPGGTGVSLAVGGTVTNGAASDSGAQIEGASGVSTAVASAIVNNFGSIVGTYSDTPSAYAGGVVLGDGGVATNGAADDVAAFIKGANGVLVSGAAGVVVNYAVIESGGYDGVGVKLTSGGSVINYGQIAGHGAHDAAGVELTAGGGAVVNGGAGDLDATISGDDVGVEVEHGGTVTNFATIVSLSTTYGAGVHLADGGRLINGSASDPGALMQGPQGVLLIYGHATNFGIIRGDVLAGAGIVESSLVNGGGGDRAALIEGPIGAAVITSGTLTNFGTIRGTNTYGVVLNGTLINFGTVIGRGGVSVLDEDEIPSTVVVEARSVFVGAIKGERDVLDIGSGRGVLALLPGDDVRLVDGARPATFDDFATLDVEKGATFTLNGLGAVAGGESLIDGGSLAIARRLTVVGTLDVTGTLSGVGSLAVAAAGTVFFEHSPVMTVAEVTQAGGTVDFASLPVVVTGRWNQTSGEIATSEVVDFAGVGNLFEGTLSGLGRVEMTAGSDVIAGTALSDRFIDIEGAAVTLSGSIALSGNLNVEDSTLAIAAAGANLSGGGRLRLLGSGAAGIIGATAATTLDSDVTIDGGGDLGEGRLSLVNQAGGTIDANIAAALVIDTGAAVFVNDGRVETTGAGGLTIASPLQNDGILIAERGGLTVRGAVTGTGSAHVANAGMLTFQASFSQNVRFGPGGGELVLAQSQAFFGVVAGLAGAGASLDLEDIAFAGAGEATFAADKNDTGGILTVADGTHTARIRLVGDFAGSTFTASDDGHGGVIIVAQPPPVMAARPSAAQFVGWTSALASPGGSPVPAASHEPLSPGRLAVPRGAAL